MQLTDVYDAFAFEALTVGGTAVPFTALTANPSSIPGAKAAYCTLEGTVQVRYRMDGTAPTSTVGHLSATPSATAPAVLVILGASNVRRFQAISVGANVTLHVTYLR